MDKSRGYILLWRSIEDSWVFKIKPFCPFGAWVDLINMANHADNFFFVRGIRIDVKRGQVGMSQPRLAMRWGWSRGRVRRFIAALETGQMIVQQKNKLTQIISLVNYEEGQSAIRQTVQQKANKRYDRKPTDGTTDGLKQDTIEGTIEDTKKTSIAQSPPTEAAEPPFTADPPYFLILNDKTHHEITASEVERYHVSYPAPDIKQEFRNMRQWCIDNPSKRKTHEGIHKFVNTWLKKAQNSGNGAQESAQPRLTFSQQRLANTMRASQEFLEEMENHGNK